MPDFVQTAVREIDDQLRVLKDEAARLEAARAALTGAARRPGRRSAGEDDRTRPRRASRTNGDAAAAPSRRGANTRANQALELVREKPGLTIPQIDEAMDIQPNYLYRVLPRLASDGLLTRDGQGWHPASSATSTPANGDRASTRRRSQGGKSEATPATNGRTARGATRASVLAALAGGDAMTAGQVAAKAGLARPTVSTTLSKLAKTGEVQKAARGYRLSAG